MECACSFVRVTQFFVCVWHICQKMRSSHTINVPHISIINWYQYRHSFAPFIIITFASVVVVSVLLRLTVRGEKGSLWSHQKHGETDYVFLWGWQTMASTGWHDATAYLTFTNKEWGRQYAYLYEKKVKRNLIIRPISSLLFLENVLTMNERMQPGRRHQQRNFKSSVLVKELKAGPLWHALLKRLMSSMDLGWKRLISYLHMVYFSVETLSGMKYCSNWMCNAGKRRKHVFTWVGDAVRSAVLQTSWSNVLGSLVRCCCSHSVSFGSWLVSLPCARAYWFYILCFIKRMVLLLDFDWFKVKSG